MDYKDDDFLMLSGIQHFSFCRRQWALIHMEQQWKENLRTTEGKIIHSRVHDASNSEKRSGILTLRDLKIFSYTLGISGACDAVEFTYDECGVELKGHSGKWKPYPIEYKRGQPKVNDADRLQLCAQAMCLEEMLCCDIEEGALFYHEIRRRERIILDDSLRSEVKKMLEEMHRYAKQGYTPTVKPSKSCKACSLNDLCLPSLNSQKNNVKQYIISHLGEV